ncbi:MAG: hypothetical protein ACLRWM_13305 [Streptococcus sp.]
MKDGNGNCFEIKEITFKASDSIALNKSVEASSTSTNDPGNTKELVVDGNTIQDGVHYEMKMRTGSWLIWDNIRN